MEQLLQHLRNLSFTEMEAKIMVELAGKGPSSGYEVAKGLGVSRSNVYAALQRLTQHGFLRRSAGEPVRYSMLKPEELTQMISGQVKESLAFIETRMPQVETDQQPFYSAQGDRNVLDMLFREMDRAENEIIVDVWREEASLIRKGLEKAEGRGVKLLWSCVGEDAAVSRLFPWASLEREEGSSQTGRRFSFVIDRRWCMLGMRGEDCMTQGLVTEHPVMVELLLQHFTQEMVLYELEQDIGEELSERYGPRYEQIYRKYVGPENMPEEQEGLAQQKDA
ncbi:helix-turn-helix domain-containing protein [Paenibacillus sp.]|jgi:sugar-specific transcriptional regulator TrmB|uniref:TrmB family transcriptional regulator n=1 Tax=Paenibacillus sp. TaxID=58172 RepID=UPI00282EEE61|nr:helix-turn-helix domain-containing protein [Paenibacillus sp.]MDR0269222.1 helix-turn-helix domain-containing protein [Paenibacillus sp.]